MNNIANLFSHMDEILYPSDMIEVRGSIKGNAFFPGGTGLLNGEHSLEGKSVMILGQDFDCESSYEKSLVNGQEDIKRNATWRNLLYLLDSAGIDRNDCFFTNAIMGVRKADKATGKSPAFKDSAFIKQCQVFFLYQLETQRPKAILALGKYVAEFLAPTSEQLTDWHRIKNFSEIDKAKSQIKKNVIFSNGLTANLALLVHPSFRLVNVSRRSFQDEKDGHQAEIKMIQAIL